ncbi:MAG: symmetrical bis(5'-nucleosyl)-tetraphosphatase [Gammaproteobacteria bacterium]|jgi:bis(5'-nucleosyl)-tetraphosphatase (symmetrical)
MSTYVIGDVQGCFAELMALLENMHFNEHDDTLWFCGDLVNRGKASLETLRFIKQLPNKITVLGNHDLHLLAYAQNIRPKHPKDTLDDILQAPDRDELLAWLQQQPLLHHDEDLNITLVHAGIYPLWDLAKAKTFAKEVEAQLQSSACSELLKDMYGEQPTLWSDNLTGIDRYRFIINAFTRMRFVNEKCELMLHADGAPKDHPELIPWFDFPDRKPTGPIVFGHWSRLGKFNKNNEIFCLDTGCVWGGPLTGIRLDIL